MTRERLGALLREATASARSQPVASILTLLIVAGMIVAVTLTTGRTVAAEQGVLSTIDSAGTRSIVIRADDGAGVTSEVMTRVRAVEGIEWVAGFSSAIDATNALVPDGTRVPTRYVYTDDLALLDIPEKPALPGALAYASPDALEQLGLPDAAGGITLTTGAGYAIAGPLSTPDFLTGFEPLVLIPQPESTDVHTVNLIIAIAERPELVAPVADTLVSLLAPNDASRVTVQTSEALAHLRTLIQGQLGSFSRGLVLVMLAITGTLVAIILYGLVMMRRKDFGRRRALGATRGLIIRLILTQTALLALVGTFTGTLLAAGILITVGDPLPGPVFLIANGILATATATLAALLPALLASRREPIRELRVP